ncbi:MAG: valine--pyruvate transaminase [Proteobacteria bacterium]|nr:valine--pyruvate transaminase [Pseudomonadota bacterium]
MKYSDFGLKFSGESGILRLMDDLGNAMAEGGREMLMLGGGNPAHIPEVQSYFRNRMNTIMECGNEFERVIGNYDTPQGEKAFIAALAALLRDQYGWEIGPENIALTNGSQTAFFYLFNMFAGRCPDGVRRKILLPLAPEYIGYADVGLTDDFFVAYKPEIQFLDDQMFKYRVDFSELEITDEIGAICVSRPTNPTGNVLTDEEVEKLSVLAAQHDIPLILDNAYGTPFPNIIFTDAEPIWNDHIVLSMSLSKMGLPGARTGIVVAHPTIVETVSALNAVFCLAPNSMGVSLALSLFQSGRITELSREVIRPYYQRKAEYAFEVLSTELRSLDFRIHKPEGALFLWLWMRDLPIADRELYQRLKKRKTLVVPGHYFFPGLAGEWRHKSECIRITYAMDDDTVEKGLKIIAEEVKKAYAGS